jgi:hypothetical protein
MKTIAKLVIAALIVNATWRAGSAYWRYYKFKDELQQTALFGGSKTERDLQIRVLEIAQRMQLPVAPDSVTVRRDEYHTAINASYTERIELVPTYYYPYQFNVNLDILTLAGSLR